MPRQSSADRTAHVEGSRVEPIQVGPPGLFRVVTSLLRQHSRQGKRHLGIIRGPARQRIPGPVVGEVAHALRVSLADPLGALKFDLAVRRIARELAQQTPLRAPDDAGDLADGRNRIVSLLRVGSRSRE